MTVGEAFSPVFRRETRKCDADCDPDRRLVPFIARLTTVALAGLAQPDGAR